MPELILKVSINIDNKNYSLGFNINRIKEPLTMENWNENIY